ncbi:MAG TPA: response regulator transcription factor [Cytophagaceae bacterium]|jgi:two-component system alkaline phosphatase synthesis response regulator PhoP|nr:response regulator transcription factor [Cytophagaceae bacterium]
MTKKNRVLVVDDESDILEMLDYNLSKEGYEVFTAVDGLAGIEAAKEHMPHLILLDVMMPKIDGIETCRRIREISKLKDVYIIFLTARGEEFTEIAAFEAGANDYLTKPIKPRALLSRLAAFFRRDQQVAPDPSAITAGDLVIDRASYTVTKNGEKIVLPKKEFELLYFLSLHPDVVYGRDDLLKYIWGSDVYVVPRTIDVHIRKVREKIGEGYITTIKGIGYKFSKEEK